MESILICVTVLGCYIAIYTALHLSTVVHEYAHLFASFLFRAGIKSMTIGVGPTVFKYRIKWTVIKFKIFPLWGAILPRDPDNCLWWETPFDSLKYYQKIIVYLSGPLANLVLAWVSLMVLETKYYTFSIPSLVSRVSLYYVDLMKITYHNILSVLGLHGFDLAYNLERHMNFHLFNPTYGIVIIVFLFSLTTINLFLGLFNLIPLFPLDGGRCVTDTISLFTPQKGKRRNLLTAYQFIGLVAVTAFTTISIMKTVASFFN